jgi:pSer/pThr/pTyr-binding forkhead associated (FHA) protein/ribosomal protein L40E
MIVCPNCKHGNPDGATNCEACYTALPATKACPSCGASIQIDATFCGQCGHNLKAATSAPIQLAAPVSLPAEPSSVGLPPTVLTVPAADPVLPNSHLAAEATADTIEQDLTIPPIEVAVEPLPVTTLPSPEIAVTPVATQIQVSLRQLLHLQTNTNLEIPPQLQIIHLGKPNDQTPPDIDVSGFPCAEVVSRIHANIRVEEENYYLEDVGSANGTYINHNILPKGNRHLLRIGDRIGLGKGDLVTFIFQ